MINEELERLERLYKEVLQASVSVLSDGEFYGVLSKWQSLNT
jgi:hypothetical protein